MKIVIHASPNIEWQGRYARQAVAGLRLHGHTVGIVADTRPAHCDVSIIMGPNMYQKIEQASTPYLMFNRKLIGNNPKTVHENCTIGWNGFNGNALFCVDEVDPKRLEQYLTVDEIEDWKPDGEHVHLIEQTNTGRSKEFKNINQFYNKVRKEYSGPMKLRKKPVGEANIDPQKIKSSLSKARAIANLNSTISIEALAAGVPVVSYDEGDPAYAISGRDLNKLSYPDNRLEFFQYLAHCQWTQNEIQRGEFWEQVWPIRGPKLNEWSSNGSSG